MSAAHSTRHDELLPAYALGALDGEELRELEAHLAAGCAQCDRQLRLWQGGLEELAVSVTPVAPSEATRQRVLELAGNAPTAPATPASPIRPGLIQRWTVIAAAVALLIALGQGIQQGQLAKDLERLGAERARLAKQVEGLEQQLGAARSETRRMAEALAIITAPEGQAVQLAGLDPNPEASGHTFVDRQQGRAVFYARNLPALQPDRIYQLWWIEDGKPVSAGTFNVDEGGTGSVRVERLAPSGQIQAWAVTNEPEGGAPQPTGAMVLKG